MKRTIALVGVLCAALGTAALAGGGAAAGVEQFEVFTSGSEDYHTFRIPAVIGTRKGTLLAFCEGRKSGRGDSGDIDTLLKRSTDGGKTWGPIQLVWDDGPNTAGNPCPVVDRSTGTVWLLLTRNLGRDTEAQIKDRTSAGSREVWVSKSTDDGVSWSKPVEITATTKAPDWTWYATGPGVGIQLKSGRLLIPCDHNVAVTKVRRSHAIYSDDHGATWKLGDALGDHTNECQAAELKDGSVLMNMRSYHGKNRRAIATSRDGGASWSDVTLDDALIEPVCQASLIAVPTRSNTLFFSNPASTKRENVTVRRSRDGGKTWPSSLVLHRGPSAYSCLTPLPDQRIGCLYERGDTNAYERITFARIPTRLLSETSR